MTKQLKILAIVFAVIFIALFAQQIYYWVTPFDSKPNYLMQGIYLIAIIEVWAAALTKINYLIKFIAVVAIIWAFFLAYKIDQRWYYEKTLYERFVVGNDRKGYCSLSRIDKASIERFSYQGIEDCADE